MASQNSLKNQKGFAMVFLLSLLPLVLTAALILLFSQFLIKNWMQSMHICRTELLNTQKRSAQKLSALMKTNLTAGALRLELQKAQTDLALAILSGNQAAAAIANAEIRRIRSQQLKLDRVQKSLIQSANFEMRSGIVTAVRKLRSQSQSLQARLPSYLQFQIHSIQAIPKTLAVRPDLPELAPVYELETPFTSNQSLSVSWISQFQIKNSKRFQWVQSKHQRKESCSVSLTDKEPFVEVLNEDKLSWKP